MKKNKLLLLVSLFCLVGCGSAAVLDNDSKQGVGINQTTNLSSQNIDFDKLEDNNYVPKQNNRGELGNFELINPFNNAILDSLETFSWNPSTNADKYSLEICSSNLFINDNDSIDYYIQNNINATSFTINAVLALKNTYYYWRVIAYNDQGYKYSSSVFSFFMKAPEVEEVPIDLGDADDWLLHPVGSYADIAIDNSNFFNNNQESLMITFKQEDTSRGVPESDGWIVVTKTIEKSIYGTDALFFNLYYSGQDASIFIRLVDRDNEYWYAPVQVSNNAKQSVILKFSDFIQRTGDVTVANQQFDYERIKYFEVVFEKSFGDGVLLLSGAKAIKFDNYRDFFIEKLDFSEYDESYWTYEGYDFEKEINGAELTIKYYGTNDAGKPKINGYGFAKLNVNRYFYSGDSIKLRVKYTGYKASNVILRIYEEDTDRWSYKIPVNTLSDEYTDLLIPFAAFAPSALYGDGKRQFYNIINLQFGLEGAYGEGTLSFDDFEIVYKKDYQTEIYRQIGDDGLIENFDNYKYSTELYMTWMTSNVNKDEYMTLNSTNKVGGSNNPYSGEFAYKSDMEPASYYIPVTTDKEFHSLSIWMKDASVKTGDAKFGHITNFSAEVNIYIRLRTDEIYMYHLGTIDRSWYQYVIPFDQFTLTNREDVNHVPNQITGGGLLAVGFSLQYFYYGSNGKPAPQYTNTNVVYVDNIYLGNDSAYEKILKEKIIHMDGNVALVDDFEDYRTTNDLLDNWIDGRDYEYQDKVLSEEVSSEGGSNSIAMKYKCSNESPAYYIAPSFGSDVKARGIRISLASEKRMTVHINFYLTISGTAMQYRATLSNINNEWTEYSVGFTNFAVISGISTRALSANDMIYINRISIGMTCYDGSQDLTWLYADNIKLDYSLSYSTNTRRVIE